MKVRHGASRDLLIFRDARRDLGALSSEIDRLAAENDRLATE
jgi:hypothetical protein